MRPVLRPGPPTCYFERDPDLALVCRATAGGVGTLLLMLAATGSGLAVQRLSHGVPALGLMASAVATGSALAYVAAQLGGGIAGALLALLVITVAYPLHPAGGRSATGQAITSAELLL